MTDPSASGSFAVSDYVGPECIRLLTNMLGMTSFANTSANKDFQGEYAYGDTVHRKYPQMHEVVDGPTYVPKTMARQTCDIKVDQWVQLPWGWNAWDDALSVERTEEELRENYFKPAMATMQQEIESRYSRYLFYNISNVVGQVGTTPTQLQTFGAATTRMIENGAMNSARKYGMFISAQQQENAVAASSAIFNPGNEISRAFKEGYIGRFASAEWFTSMSLQTFTTGIWANVASGVTVSGAGQAGNSINVSCTTGDTFVPGDIISFSTVYNTNPMTRVSTNRLKQFKIMVSTTGVAGAATLTIKPAIIASGPYQNCSNMPGNGDTLTLWPGTTMVNATAKTGVFGVALNDLGAFLAGVKIKKLSKGGAIEKFQQSQDPDSGLSLNFVEFSNPETYNTGHRIDTLFGFGDALLDRCACLIASQY